MRQNAAQVVKKLIADEGWKGLYRGLGPRFFSMSAWGTSMILAYEYLSMKLSLTINCFLMTYGSGPSDGVNVFSFISSSERLCAKEDQIIQRH